MTEAEIASEIKSQNELYKDLKDLPEAEQRNRTNAVARSHSGTNVLHVQEWYSGSHYRLDQTDVGMLLPSDLISNTIPYRNGYVNIDDPALSPYKSFFIDFKLRDIQLSKTILYGRNDLWRAFGLDQEVALPLLIALLDPASAPKGRPATDDDLGTLKISTSHAEELQNGTRANWHLEASRDDGKAGEARFILRGKYLSPDQPGSLSDIQVTYTIGRSGQKYVCMEAVLTNFTSHAAFMSKREDFDDHGFPHVWHRITIATNSSSKQIDVTFKEIDLGSHFKDEDVFLPKYPTNYIVSDVSSGEAVILQKPSYIPVARQPLVQTTSRKRLIVLSALGLLFFGIGFTVFRQKIKGNGY